MKGLFGGLLLAIGILIAGASGLCSLVVGIVSLNGETLTLVPLILLFGGVPFSIGFGLILWGRHLLRSARREAEETQ